MPRIRTIKPEMFQDEKLAPLPVVDRFVFLGLVAMADDAGRLLDNVKVIDAFIFPLSEDTSRGSLDTLATLSRVSRYVSASGQALLQITNWNRHQRVDKPSAYVLPAPPTEAVAVKELGPILATPSRESREGVGESSRSDPDLRPTTYDLRPSSHLRARNELADTLTPAGRVRFIATCDGYLQGLGLPAGLSATDDDVELAAADWLANNSDAKPSALAFRAYVEKIIRRRLAAERSAPAAPVPGFTRTNGKVSSGEQGFINARLSSLIDPYDLSHQQEKS